MRTLLTFSIVLFLLSCGNSQDNQKMQTKNENKDTKKMDQVHTEAKEYKHGNTVLEGFLAYDQSVKAKRPGVILVHAWKGLGDFEKEQAKKVAELGYVVLAVDMYGKGVRAKNAEEAKKLSTIYKSNRKLMRDRVLAGLEALKKEEMVDPTRIGAMGFCFGGTTVLELARSGADVRGVVTFHGGLDSPNPEDGKNIKGSVLILHGGDDPYVPPENVKAVMDELNGAKVDSQLVVFSGTVHSFTEPAAKSEGAHYNEKSAKRSWIMMKNFFEEVLK